MGRDKGREVGSRWVRDKEREMGSRWVRDKGREVGSRWVIDKEREEGSRWVRDKGREVGGTYIRTVFGDDSVISSQPAEVGWGVRGRLTLHTEQLCRLVHDPREHRKPWQLCF